MDDNKRSDSHLDNKERVCDFSMLHVFVTLPLSKFRDLHERQGRQTVRARYGIYIQPCCGHNGGDCLYEFAQIKKL